MSTKAIWKPTALLLIITAFLAGIAGSGPALADPERVLWSWQETAAPAHPGYLAPGLDGRVLAVLNGYRDSRVVEIASSGEVTWSFGPVQANSAQALPNGHILVADSGAPGNPLQPRVLELDREGQMVWEYLLPGRGNSPQEAKRLADGNTLIVTPRQVLEVNRDRQVVWRWAGFWRGVSAERLANGHTLVVDRGIAGGGRVLELDFEGKVVWSYETGLIDPVAAKRLENGNTLITDLGNFWQLEVDPAGKTVRVVGWRQVLAALGMPQNWYAASWPGDRLAVSAGKQVLLVDSKSVQTYIDGLWLETPVLPVIVNGQVLVPVRPLAEALGLSAYWDQQNKTVALAGQDQRLEMSLNSSAAWLNGTQLELEAAPVMADNHVMVPAQVIGEAFRFQYNWDPEGRVLELFSAGENQPGESSGTSGAGKDE